MTHCHSMKPVWITPLSASSIISTTTTRGRGDPAKRRRTRSHIAENGVTRRIECSLTEADKEHTECIKAIASGAVLEVVLYERFAMLYEEEQRITEQQNALQFQNHGDSIEQHQLEAAMQKILEADFQLTEYDDVLVRKLIEWWIRSMCR